MTSSSKYPTAGANATGIGTNAWTSPTNIYADDTNYSNANTPTNYLKATAFGFSIPSDAIIEGIVVEVNRRCTALNRAYDSAVSLVKAGTITGDNKATASYYPTSLATASYGSSNDLWGTTWSYSDINNSNFGAVFACQASVASTCYVDFIVITVYYSVLVTLASAVTETASVASGLTRERRFAVNILQTPSAIGSAEYSSDLAQYRIVSAGADMWGTSDSFGGFYQLITGNFILKYKVESVINGGTYYKAGCDIRQELTAASAHISLNQTSGGIIQRLLRAASGGTTSATNASTTNPWHRVTKSGNTLTSEHSANGTDWTTVATDDITGWPAALYVWMIGCANSSSQMTAQFSNLSLT